MPKSLGTILRNLREQHGLSQRAFADAIGLNATMLSRLESGSRTGLSFETMCRLSIGLGISLDELAREMGLIPGPKRARAARVETLDGIVLRDELSQLRRKLASAQSALDNLSRRIR